MAKVQYEVRVLDSVAVERDFMAIRGYPLHEAAENEPWQTLERYSEQYWLCYRSERFARAREVAMSFVERDFDMSPQIIRWIDQEPRCVWQITSDGEGLEKIHGDDRR